MSSKSQPPGPTSRPTKNVPPNKNAAAGTDKNEGTQGAFVLRVINSLTYNQTKLTVTKESTIADVLQAYSPYEAHPESYIWQDMFGKTLDPKKTLVQNGIVGRDEVVEFDGIGKEPCVLLVFKDGFENDKPRSLNPMNQRRDDKSDARGICRNY